MLSPLRGAHRRYYFGFYRGLRSFLAHPRLLMGNRSAVRLLGRAGGKICAACANFASLSKWGGEAATKCTPVLPSMRATPTALFPHSPGLAPRHEGPTPDPVQKNLNPERVASFVRFRADRTSPWWSSRISSGHSSNVVREVYTTRSGLEFYTCLSQGRSLGPRDQPRAMDIERRWRSRRLRKICAAWRSLTQVR